MPSALIKLFGRCFPGLLARDNGQAVQQHNKRYAGEFNFVVPRKDFAKFEEMKPEDGAILTVSQYMFLYRYITVSKKTDEPAPDFERVYYFFKDKSSTFLLKGWVPTISYDEQGYIPERKLIANLNKKIKLLSANDSRSVYVKEQDIQAALPADYAGVSLQCGQSGSEMELKSESRIIPCFVRPGPPQFKSTYNWGVINTWSRHMAQESDDNVPVDIFSRMNQIEYQSASNFNRMEALDKDIADVIEGRPISKRHVTRRANASCGMVTSTLDTRDRNVRPRAAKGPRKSPGLWNMWLN